MAVLALTMADRWHAGAARQMPGRLQALHGAVHRDAGPVGARDAAAVGVSARTG
jgi:hypothetical protein